MVTNVEAPGDTDPELVLVRATVNLADAHTRIRAGSVVLVNPDIPYIRERLAGGYLVPLPQKDQPKASV